MRTFSINKFVLTSLPNPNCQLLCMEYNDLKDITVNNKNTKSLLPVHIVLGALENVKIKTKTPPKMKKPGKPVAKKSKF